MDFLSGERLVDRADVADVIEIDGTPAGRLGPNGRRDLAAGFVPEERIGHAAVPDMNLVENAVLTGHRRAGFVTGGFMRITHAGRFAQRVCDTFKVKHAGIKHAARSLSGGNLQKFVIGREIAQGPRLLVAMQPTWGVDSGAAAAIQQALIDLAEGGAAMVVISQDLDELLAISHRIAVLYRGRLSAPRATDRFTVEEIGLLMAGHGGAEGHVSMLDSSMRASMSAASVSNA